MPNATLWDAALNARFALPGLIRSANLSFLSGRGRAELLASGVSQIIDLRDRAERQIDPAPFAGTPLYLNLPLLPRCNRALDQAGAEVQSNAEYDRVMLDQSGNGIAAVFGAIHDAPPGPVLICCHLGKDRTGLVAALAQELCGVPHEQIAGDYQESNRHLGAVYAEQPDRQPDPEKRARLAGFQVSHPQTELATLDHLDAEWNGVLAYLEAFGFGREEQAVLAARLTCAGPVAR